MSFAEELARVLPDDLPERENVILKAARHLELITEVNAYMNLTRIATPREAAIKHVLDSLLPWRLFAEAGGPVLDAGTGAGFPGIPLAAALPGVRFVLAESIQKKARFVTGAAEELGLTNVEVLPRRAEEVLRDKPGVELITARAVAPIGRAVGLFAPALRAGARALLYKGPDADAEIAEASNELKKAKLRASVLQRYDLPDACGSRTIVEVSR